MGRARFRFEVWRVLSLLLAGIALPGCSPSPAGSTPEPSPAPAPVEVRAVKPERVSSDVSYASSLYVERDVRLRARRSGMVVRIHADRGDRVREGQVLAELETDLASAELEMAEQEQRMADADYESKKSLRDQKIVSPNDFLKAETARDLAASRVALARSQLDRCNVRAPFDGIVVERWAQLGERVQEDDDQPLFRVVADDRLRARIDVPEDRLAGLASGGGAEIRAEGGPSLSGTVVFVSPAVDAGSGTAPVIVEVRSAAGRLRPGASVRVRLADGGRAVAPTFRIPAGAVREEGNAEASLLVVFEGRALDRKVRILERGDGSLLVTGGIGPEDSVILGDRTVVPGDLVVVRKE